MDARKAILGKLRAAQTPFTDVQPVVERRRMIPMRAMTDEERLNLFITEAEALGSFVYRLSPNDAVEQIMDLLAGDSSVLSWDDDHLPLPSLNDILSDLGVRRAAFDDGEVRVGLTGVTAALAATGSIIVESGAGRSRGASLLPDLHIALMRKDQLLPDLESWEELQRADGYGAFKRTSNTIIISGPSKTADIAHQLVKGAHGPRELHLMILEE